MLSNLKCGVGWQVKGMESISPHDFAKALAVVHSGTQWYTVVHSGA